MEGRDRRPPSPSASLALAGCGGSSGASRQQQRAPSNLVGFSILEQANKQVIADFNKTSDGKGVDLQAVLRRRPATRAARSIGGQKADYVHFSLEPDVHPPGRRRSLVADDWNAGPNKGIVSDSVVVIVVRKGNPKNIKGWDDLVKPGVEIVTPNPGSSGSAQWNILAAYGHVLANGGTEADAKAYLTKFFKQRRGPAGQRPRRHHRLPERHRRRADLLRERGDPGPAERRGLRLRRPRRRRC